MEWYKFRTAQWYRKTRGMTPTEKGDYMDATVDALEDEVEGRTPLADSMILEAREYSQKQRERRNGGAGRPAADNHGEPRLTTVNHGAPITNTPTHQHTNQQNQQTDRQNQPTNPTNPKPPPPVGVGGGNLGGMAGRALEGLTVGAGGDPLQRFMGSPKETVWQVPDALLPRAVALYCRADNQERTEAAFKRILPLVGASRFRAQFGRFIAEGEQGELDNVRDRAACFMARLKESQTP